MAIHEIRVEENFSDPHAHEVERQALHLGLDVTGLATKQNGQKLKFVVEN